MPLRLLSAGSDYPRRGTWPALKTPPQKEGLPPVMSPPTAEARLPVLPALYQLAPHYEAVRVVGEGAGLQADYVLALHGPQDAHLAGRDDALLEDLVGIAGPVGVGEEDLVALLELVEVPEHQVALCPRIADPVAGDVDVGLPLPRETRAPDVDHAVVERLVVAAPRGVVDGHAVNPLHPGDGELEPLALGRLQLGTVAALYPGDDPLGDASVELGLELLGDPAVHPPGILGRGRRAPGEDRIAQEAEADDHQHGSQEGRQHLPRLSHLHLYHHRPPFSCDIYGR